MSTVLFLSMPSHGHVNSTLGLVSELVKQGEEVVYFSSPAFREKIEHAGALFRPYAADLDIFKAKEPAPAGSREEERPFAPLLEVIRSAELVIAGILSQTRGQLFGYMIHSAAFPFTGVLAQILGIPTVSSLAVFAGLKDFFEMSEALDRFPGMEELTKTYREVSQNIEAHYGVKMPASPLKMIFNIGDLNLVYTSEFFISPADRSFFDDRFRFVGPPVNGRKEDLDFPFEKLKGKKVVYISLGTVFGNYNRALYNVFFQAFAGRDVTVVLAAYKVDLTGFDVPENFIVRNYVPQTELLKYTDAAITHAGLNSISDLIHQHVPFVAIPLGADQPELAGRVEELGAAISLPAETLDAETLRSAVDKVINDPNYLENIKRIDQSFREAGGYPKAVEEIFKLKAQKGVADKKSRIE